MKLDIVSISLFCLRLSPVLLASHFALQSMLNQDTGGVLYLTGLLFASLFALSFKNIMSVAPSNNSNNDLICKSIGLDSFENISLSQIVLAYTLGYFTIAVCTIGNRCTDKWQPVAFFSFLILSNFILDSYNKCLNTSSLIVSAVIGMLSGMAWAGFLKGAGYNNLPLFGGISDKITCAKAKSSISCAKTT